MEFSIAGAAVCAALIILMRALKAPLIVGLLASLAFGATALVSLPAIGGSSPLIYAFFQIALIGAVIMRRAIWRDLSTLFRRSPHAGLMLFFIAYVVIGAIFLPRLFAGQTSAFVPTRIDGRVIEVPLTSVSGNITQTFYFLLNGLSFFAFSVLLIDKRNLRYVRQGFLVWMILHISMGFIDLGGKLTGLGDVLAPVRSATYAMLTTVSEGSFWRISGGYAEASSFGAATLVLLAFSFSYWRRTQNRTSLILSGALLLLLLMSTSSTAYVGAAIVAIPLLASILRSSLSGRVSKPDLVLLIMGIAGTLTILAVFLYQERLFDPIWQLIDTMIINKASSASAQERAYWNMRSIQSLYDTFGLGIGLGSSRSSSWAVAVISQLGLIGALMYVAFMTAIFRKQDLENRNGLAAEDRATIASLRAAAIAVLITATISGGGADPGIIFSLALAAVLSVKHAGAKPMLTSIPRPEPAIAQYSGS